MQRTIRKKKKKYNIDIGLEITTRYSKNLQMFLKIALRVLKVRILIF